MAKFEIITTPEEQDAILAVLKVLQGETIAVSAIAKKAKMKQSRARYVLTDLEDSGKIRRVPTKAINKHYVRYSYEILV